MAYIICTRCLRTTKKLQLLNLGQNLHVCKKFASGPDEVISVPEIFDRRPRVQIPKARLLRNVIRLFIEAYATCMP